MASCVEYIAYSTVGQREVNVAFAGRFESLPVVWNAIIRCLPADANELQQQFIDINAQDPIRPEITIGLPLATINEPDILKTIMMVRQYRNLRRGRHEFLGRRKIGD